MDALSTNMHLLVLEGGMSISNLNKLEDHLKSIHEVVSRGNTSISMPKSELLAQLFAFSADDRGQLGGMDINLALLEGMSGYQDRALACVVSVLRTLEVMVEDMEKLRERIAEPELVSDAIPIVHMESLMAGLERLKGRRMGAKQLEERIVNRISGSVKIASAE